MNKNKTARCLLTDGDKSADSRLSVCAVFIKKIKKGENKNGRE